MPLITCPYCGHHPVYDQAEACPKCGGPIRNQQLNPNRAMPSEILSVESNRVSISGRAEYATINEALHAAQDGDEILLAAGVFNEKIVINRSLTIRSHSSQQLPVITAMDEDVITITGTACVSLFGVAVKPTTSSVDPTAAKDALSVNSDDGDDTSPNRVVLTLRDCQFLGAVDCHFTKLSVARCSVSGPSHTDAQGDKELQHYGISGWKSELSIDDTTVSAFQTGVYASRSSLNARKLRVRDCNYAVTLSEESLHLTNFDCDRCSSGIRVDNPNAPVLIENGRFLNPAGSGTAFNLRRGQGKLSELSIEGYFRGIDVSAESELIVAECRITRCKSAGVSAYGNCHVTLDRCSVLECGDGCYSRKNSTITKSRCSFRNNKRDHHEPD